jgi:hypothetical protein
MIALPPEVEDKRQLAHGLQVRAKRNRKRPSSAQYNQQKAEMDLLTWVCTYRNFLQPDMPFTLHDHLYTIDMFKVQAQEVVFMKAGQVTVSELLVSYALHGCDQRAANVLYMMPTSDDVSDYSSTRFGLALEASP